MKVEPSAQRGKRWIVLLPPILAACALAVIWLTFDLGSLRSLEQVRRSLESLRHEPRAGLYVIGGFGALSPLFVPMTGLVVATALTFGALHGFGYAMAGICAAACTTYWSGRLIGSTALLALSGPALTRATRALQTHAFWASLLSRMAPVGNFTVMNMLAGSMRIPFGPFLLGSALGAAPGTLLICSFAEQARAWLSQPSSGSRSWILLGLGALIVFVVVARRLRRRRPSV